jgi:site-specific recombinase
MASLNPDLPHLLETLDLDADLVHRHLWLIALFDWIRGDRGDAQACVARVEILLDVLDARPETRAKLQQWWRTLIGEVDGSTLLSDYGFATRNAFVSELIQRLNSKWLPTSPETTDGSELFDLVMPSPQDAQWVAALPQNTLARLAQLLTAPAVGHHAGIKDSLTHWQDTLLDAITFCTGQIRAAGFTPEIRTRMDPAARGESPFHALSALFEAVRDAWLAGRGVDEAVQNYKQQLEACRHAAATVYDHLDAHGISVDLVFRLRQMRERVLRARALLDCLLDDPHHNHSAKLVSQMAALGQSQRSVSALVANSSSLLAAKVAERSSETGEHYITRNRDEYRAMLSGAAGGGAITALTTAMKFGVMALGLSAFWYGFWAGVGYAVSFVVIQLLHFTLATKQPAMTAPAMAAKLRDVSDTGALDQFVDEVTHLVRSQTAAVIGNVGMVFPATVLLALGAAQIRGAPMIGVETANYVLHSLQLWGPSLLFAAFTGILLFASSILAGWVENWFVLHRLDSAIRFNPRSTRWLGVARADRWATFLRHNISGFAANISLGFMLGLIPAVLSFLAIPLDVRHVTLSAGQLGAACATLGWDVARSPALWWALAALPCIGLLNVGVSFFFAFRVALRAHDVSDVGRERIYRAIARRLRRAPLSFFWPARESA